MAGIQTFEEEFLTCSICTEIYTDPCTLRCQHSFCRKCVTNFIMTRADAIRSKTIPCAFCRQVNPVPNPSRPPIEWAGQLNPSLLLQGLVDRHQRGHIHEKDHNVCFLCKEIGEINPASSWCSDCELNLCSRCSKIHLKAPLSKDHDVLDLIERAMVRQRRRVKCPEHILERIKFVCKDCNQTICTSCRLLNHNSCKDVVTIESVVPEIKAALTEKLDYLGKLLEEKKVGMREKNAKIEHLKNDKTKIKLEIQLAFERANTLLKRKERECLDKLEILSDQQIAQQQQT